MDILENIEINYDINQLDQETQEEVKSQVENNIQGKLDRQFRRILEQEEKQIKINIKIELDQENNYIGRFEFNINGHQETFAPEVGYQNLKNLTTHAFEHLKLKLYDQIKINYKFNNLTEALQEDIKFLIEKNLNRKLDKYLKKVLEKQDAEIHVEVDVSKNKQGKYEGSFRFNIDGQKEQYKPPMPFKYSRDLVNHAFDHLKVKLADN